MLCMLNPLRLLPVRCAAVMEPLVVIVGATGTGKSKVRLLREYFI
jgi:Tfp pilus assembly ATPase PilU